jgi:hypothetical protein
MSCPNISFVKIDAIKLSVGELLADFRENGWETFDSMRDWKILNDD